MVGLGHPLSDDSLTEKPITKYGASLRSCKLGTFDLMNQAKKYPNLATVVIS